MARVGRFATCKVSTPSSGAEGSAGTGAGGFFSLGAALRGRRVDSSSGRLPTHDAATASTADLCRFAGGSFAGAHSGISSSESSDMALRDGCSWQLDCAAAHRCRQLAGSLWAYSRLTKTTF